MEASILCPGIRLHDHNWVSTLHAQEGKSIEGIRTGLLWQSLHHFSMVCLSRLLCGRPHKWGRRAHGKKGQRERRLPRWLSGNEFACHRRTCRRPMFDPWVGRSPGGNGNPVQHSCLENLLDRGPWRATVHEVAQLHKTERLSTHAHRGKERPLGVLNTWSS